MNQLHDAIRQIVRPEIDRLPPSVKAVIIKFDDEQREATIRFRDWQGNGGFIVMEQVPVTLGGAGVHPAGPFPGDEVWVEFQGRDISSPKVISMADESFETGTREQRWSHRRQGAYLPDVLVER